MSTETWDLEDVYDSKIAPLVAQIIAICKEHRMPAVVQVQYCDREEEGPGFCTTTLPFEGRTTDKMRRVMQAVAPERHFAIAETIVTRPDGTTHYTSRLVR